MMEGVRVPNGKKEKRAKIEQILRIVKPTPIYGTI